MSPSVLVRSSSRGFKSVLLAAPVYYNTNTLLWQHASKIQTTSGTTPWWTLDDDRMAAVVDGVFASVHHLTGE